MGVRMLTLQNSFTSQVRRSTLPKAFGMRSFRNASLPAGEAGEKKCAVFAQFWEAKCAPASHLFIDNQ